MLEIGTKVPEFTLPDQKGEMRSLSIKLKAADNPQQMLDAIES